MKQGRLHPPKKDRRRPSRSHGLIFRRMLDSPYFPGFPCRGGILTNGFFLALGSGFGRRQPKVAGPDPSEGDSITSGHQVKGRKIQAYLAQLQVLAGDA